MKSLILCSITVNFFNSIYLTTQIPCGEPGIPNNGLVRLSNISLKNNYVSGTVVQYYCESNSLLFGSDKRHCLQSGRWNKEVPLCIQPLNITSYINYNSNKISGNERAIDGKLDTCFDSISSDKDSYDSWQISFNQQIQIKAIRLTFSNQNYNISYADYTLWIKSRNKKTLKVEKSIKLPIIKDKMYNFVHSFDRHISGDSIGINSIKRPKFLLCEVEIFSLSDDNELKCGTPDRPSNGRVEIYFRNNQLFANFSCSQNYFLCGTKQIKCNSSRHWSALSPLCIKKDSQTKIISVKSSTKFSKNNVQMKTTTTKLPSKPIICSQLKVEDGKFNYTNYLNLGSRAFLQCNEGFTISSEYHSSECLTNGNWSHIGNYNLSCHRIQCPLVEQIPNAKIYFKFKEHKPIYSSQIEIHCNSSKIEVLVCGLNSNWVQSNYIENTKSITDLYILCKDDSKQNTTLSNNNSIKLIDMNSSVIASVIAAIITTLIVLILFSVIIFLKRKFLASRSIPGENNKSIMYSVNQFSQIQIMDNIANRSQLSNISGIYAIPVYDNDEEVETSISSSVRFGSSHKTSIIHTYSEAFDIELNGFDTIPKTSIEDIYYEPDVLVENDIYS